MELEAELKAVGPNKVIAFVAETIVEATSGCVTAVPGYFKKKCARSATVTARC